MHPNTRPCPLPQVAQQFQSSIAQVGDLFLSNSSGSGRSGAVDGASLLQSKVQADELDSSELFFTYSSGSAATAQSPEVEAWSKTVQVGGPRWQGEAGLLWLTVRGTVCRVADGAGWLVTHTAGCCGHVSPGDRSDILDARAAVPSARDMCCSCHRRGGGAEGAVSVCVLCRCCSAS
jgi:hypothetical protein